MYYDLSIYLSVFSSYFSYLLSYSKNSASRKIMPACIRIHECDTHYFLTVIIYNWNSDIEDRYIGRLKHIWQLQVCLLYYKQRALPNLSCVNCNTCCQRTWCIRTTSISYVTLYVIAGCAKRVLETLVWHFVDIYKELASDYASPFDLKLILSQFYTNTHAVI